MRAWSGTSPVIFISLGMALLVAIPILFVVYSALTVNKEIWIRLYETRLNFLVSNTLKLLFCVGVLVLIFGVFWGWLLARYEFWGRRLWQILLLLPFSMPGYVMAYAYSSVTSPNSPFRSLVEPLVEGMPSLYSLWGVSLILAFLNYPYVYLLSFVSFSRLSQTHEEVAEIHGIRGFQKFLCIDLALAYPGIFAGLALALMEVLSDFGTVSLLRYSTLTEAVYRQLTGRFDPLGASALSLLLVILALILLSTERYLRGRDRFSVVQGKYRPVIRKRLSFSGNLCVISVLVVFLSFSFFLPLGILIFWSIRALHSGLILQDLVKPLINTLAVSILGGTLASLIAFPIAYSLVRTQTRLKFFLYNSCTLGYAIPGPVIALSVLLISAEFFPILLGSFILLPFAYTVRFLPVALQAQFASLSSVSRVYEDAGATLGANSFNIFRKIMLPLILNGFICGFLIVFVDSAKELPATLILRPLAFDTLAIKVYTNAVESLWEPASLPALLILLAGLIPTYFIFKKLP